MTLGVRVKGMEAGVTDGFLLNPAAEGLKEWMDPVASQLFLLLSSGTGI